MRFYWKREVIANYDHMVACVYDALEDQTMVNTHNFFADRLMTTGSRKHEMKENKYLAPFLTDGPDVVIARTARGTLAKLRRWALLAVTFINGHVYGYTRTDIITIDQLARCAALVLAEKMCSTNVDYIDSYYSVEFYGPEWWGDEFYEDDGVDVTTPRTHTEL